MSWYVYASAHAGAIAGAGCGIRYAAAREERKIESGITFYCSVADAALAAAAGSNVLTRKLTFSA